MKIFKVEVEVGYQGGGFTTMIEVEAASESEAQSEAEEIVRDNLRVTSVSAEAIENEEEWA